MLSRNTQEIREKMLRLPPNGGLNGTCNGLSRLQLNTASHETHAQERAYY